MDANDVARLLKERGDKQAAMARLIGISPDKFSKALKGIRRFQPEELEIMARYWGVVDPTIPTSTRRLPIVGLVSAGDWKTGFHDVMGYIPAPDPFLTTDSFAVKVEGTSMNLVASPGELLIVEPNDRELISGRYYVIRNADGDMTFKRYLENPSRLEPCSDDPAHQPIYPGQEGFEIVGRVRHKVSNL